MNDSSGSHRFDEDWSNSVWPQVTEPDDEPVRESGFGVPALDGDDDPPK